MTKTKTADSLVDLAAEAERAQQEANQRAANLAAAERDAEVRRRELVAAEYQRWLDTYDPAALAAEVTAAETELAQVLLSSTLGRALVRVVAANERRAASVSLARDAIAAGATTAADLSLDPGRYGDALMYLAALIPQAAYEAGRNQVADEINAVRAAVEAAGGTVATRPPVAYRITAINRPGEDFTDMVGALEVRFVAGEAVVQVGHPALAWFERSDGYRVDAIYGMPTNVAAGLVQTPPHPDGITPHPENAGA